MKAQQQQPDTPRLSRSRWYISKSKKKQEAVRPPLPSFEFFMSLAPSGPNYDPSRDPARELKATPPSSRTEHWRKKTATAKKAKAKEKAKAEREGKKAEIILQIARENGIPIHEDRDIIKVLEVLGDGAFIPEELYRAFAALLASLYAASKTMMGHSDGR